MDDIIRQYADQGYIGPLTAFTPEEMRAIIPQVEAEMAKQTELRGWRNRHLELELAQKLTFAPAIVDTMVNLLGPNLLVWRTNFFVVPPNKGLPWHQDEYNSLLQDPINHITAHLAITEATENNCLMIIPGSHKYSHETMTDEGFEHITQGNVEARLGTPRYRRTPGRAPEPVRIMLKPGQFIVFHPSLMHGSLDNLNVRAGKPSLMQRVKNKLTTPQESTATEGGPDRLAFGIRATVPENKVLPAAFAETLPRTDKCIILHGENLSGVNETANL
jgi:chlorinating enzyme